MKKAFVFSVLAASIVPALVCGQASPVVRDLQSTRQSQKLTTDSQATLLRDGSHFKVLVTDIGLAGTDPVVFGNAIRQRVAFSIDLTKFGFGYASALRSLDRSTSPYKKLKPEATRFVVVKGDSIDEAIRKLESGQGYTDFRPTGKELVITRGNETTLLDEKKTLGFVNSDVVTSYDHYVIGYIFPVPNRGDVLVFQGENTAEKDTDPSESTAVNLGSKDAKVTVLSGDVAVLTSLKGGAKALDTLEKRQDQYRDGLDRGSPIQAKFTLDLGPIFNMRRAAQGASFLQIKDSVLSSQRLDKESKIQLSFTHLVNSHNALRDGAMPLFVSFDSDQDGTTMNGTIGVGRTFFFAGVQKAPISYKDFAAMPVFKALLEGVGPIKSYGMDGDLFRREFGGRFHFILSSDKMKLCPLGSGGGPKIPIQLDYNVEGWRMQKVTTTTPRLFESRATVGITVGISKSFGLRFGYETGADPTSNFDRKAGVFTFEVKSMK